jgi:hypothetical protein
MLPCWRLSFQHINPWGLKNIQTIAIWAEADYHETTEGPKTEKAFLVMSKLTAEVWVRVINNSPQLK